MQRKKEGPMTGCGCATNQKRGRQRLEERKLVCPKKKYHKRYTRAKTTRRTRRWKVAPSSSPPYYSSFLSTLLPAALILFPFPHPMQMMAHKKSLIIILLFCPPTLSLFLWEWRILARMLGPQISFLFWLWTILLDGPVHFFIKDFLLINHGFIQLHFLIWFDFDWLILVWFWFWFWFYILYFIIFIFCLCISILFIFLFFFEW